MSWAEAGVLLGETDSDIENKRSEGGSQEAGWGQAVCAEYTKLANGTLAVVAWTQLAVAYFWLWGVSETLRMPF